MRKLTRVLLLCLILALMCIKRSNGQYLPRKIENLKNIVRSCKLIYMPEPEGRDYWQTIKETDEKGGGDCEDLSLYIMDKLRKEGYECWLVFGNNLCGQNHCWLRIKTIYGLFDVDMQMRTVRNAFKEREPSLYEFNKLKDWKERQEKYEGEIK